MLFLRANIAENALGGATRGPLPFKRWLLNREHRLKLKEEENAKKRADEQAEHQKSVEILLWDWNGSFGSHWWKSNSKYITDISFG